MALGKQVPRHPSQKYSKLGQRGLTLHQLLCTGFKLNGVRTSLHDKSVQLTLTLSHLAQEELGDALS